MKLAGKKALVTGGTRGIGEAIALDLATHGATVVVNSRQRDDQADQTLERIAAQGVPAHYIAADLAVPADCARCIDQAADLMDGLDILVHNAGGPSSGKIEDVSPEQWKEAFDIHVHSAYYLCRHALPHLKKNREGAILLMSSVSGIRGCPGAIAYGTVKGAILQFTRMLARDIADDNIRVNCLAPGIIRTRFHDNMSDEQRQHNLKNRIALHREGTVQDVAEVAHLLLTNEFMTGEFVVVDGGTSMQVVR